MASWTQHLPLYAVRIHGHLGAMALSAFPALVPRRHALTELALAHGYNTAFWWVAGIFAGGAGVGGVLLRPGQLGQKRTPSTTYGGATMAQAGANRDRVR